MNFNEHILKQKISKYGGSERKLDVILDDGKEYILKVSDPVRKKNSVVSYLNNAVSEYLGCKIFQSIGFATQHVVLGTYTNKTGETQTACACENLCSAGQILCEAKSQALDPNYHGTEQPMSFEAITHLANYFGDIPAENVLSYYCDMFVADALIGNTDRHNGNWGVLVDENGDSVQLAPIYDCGAAFSPMLADEELTETNLRNEALNVHSALTDDTGKRLAFSDVLLSVGNSYINDAVVRMVPEIQMPMIQSIIQNTPYISNKRKDFYTGLVEMRYEHVLIPSLQKILEQNILECPMPENFSWANAYNRLLRPLADIPLYQNGQCQIVNQVFSYIKTSKSSLLLLDEQSKPYCVLDCRNTRDAIVFAVNAFDCQNRYWEHPEALDQTRIIER